MLNSYVDSLDGFDWNLNLKHSTLGKSFDCISPLASLPSTSLFADWSKKEISTADPSPAPIGQLLPVQAPQPPPNVCKPNMFTVCGETPPPTAQLNSTNAKQWILTKLRNIVPNRGMLVLPFDVKIDLVVYDFYFEDNTLRMMIVLMDTGEMYESSMFYSDLLHLLHSIPNIYTVDKTPCSNPSFKYFYIKTNVGYAHLHNEIWASIRRGTFSKATQNWLHSEFLTAAETMQPDSYIWLTTKDIIDMQCKTQFGMLEMPLLQCNDFLCACKSVLQNYQYQQGIGVRTTRYNIQDLLRHMQSQMSHSVKYKMAPAVRKIMEHSKTTYTRRLPYSPQCQIDGKCKRTVCGFWTQCCSPDRPIVCKFHAKKLLQQNAMCTCPRHKYTSSIAIIMEPTAKPNINHKKRKHV